MSFGDRSVSDLVGRSVADPLAPFALRPEKHHVAAPTGDAILSYAIRLGVVVASGDPVGLTPEARAELAGEPFKLELIDDKGAADDAEAEAVLAGGKAGAL